LPAGRGGADHGWSRSAARRLARADRVRGARRRCRTGFPKRPRRVRQDRWWLRAPVLVAPDKFKGTMTAAEVAAAIAKGLREGGRNAEELPVADGGEGTADALVRALGGEWVEV